MINSTTQSKKCSKCGTEYPASSENFARDKNRADGLSPQCKQCVKAYKRDRVKPNYQPSPNAAPKTCECCGNTYPGTTEHFVANRYVKDGLSTNCRACTRENRRLRTGYYDKTRAHEGMRICGLCKREYPETDEFFYRSKYNARGLTYWCKECRKEYKRQASGYYDRQASAGCKVCKRCGCEYPETEEFFHRAKSRKSGLYPYCKTCQNAISLSWSISNPEKQSEMAKHWRRNNPERRRILQRVSGARRRARRLGNGGTYTVADIQAQYDQQHGQCYYCEKSLNGKYHVDHVIPLSKGGRNDPSNLVCACESCNLHKSSRTLEQWLAFISDTALLEKVERLMSTASLVPPARPGGCKARC